MNDFLITNQSNPVKPIEVQLSFTLHNFDRVFTRFNSENDWLTNFKFPSLMQFKSHIYSTETLTVLFDMALCISDRHSASQLYIVFG